MTENLNQLMRSLLPFWRRPLAGAEVSRNSTAQIQRALSRAVQNGNDRLINTVLPH